MNENPSEFVRIGLDCCDWQKLPHIKSSVAKFLEICCDKIDSIVLIAGDVTLEMLHFEFVKS